MFRFIAALFVVLAFCSESFAQYPWQSNPDPTYYWLVTNGSYHCSAEGFSFTMGVSNSSGTSHQRFYSHACGSDPPYQRSINGSTVGITQDEFDSAVSFMVSIGKLTPCGSLNCPEPCEEINTGLVGTNCCGAGQYGATYYIFEVQGCPTLACSSHLCVGCGPVDENAIGFNCCANGKYGATYYLDTNEWGCPVLKCNSGNCQNCQNSPEETEGSPCECPEGQGNGKTVYTYDSNGCPNGTECDECEPCTEPIGEDGAECECEDGSSGVIHHKTGTDGCPVGECKCGNPECYADSDRDGTPDYLEGNPLAGLSEGHECECEVGTGVIYFEDNADGCPVPKCNCQHECEGRGGDKDEDGCCDDEDPDPDDAESNCKDCDFEVLQKIGSIVSKFRSKVDLPKDGLGNPDWEFQFDLAYTPMIGIPSFGVMFGGNLKDFSWWIGSPNDNPRAEQHAVIQEARDKIVLLRSIISALFYLVFARLCFSALFNPAR